MEKLRKNWSLFLIGLTTLVLGIMAVVMALKLYQAGKNPVAPTAPQSQPEACNPACSITFTITKKITGTPTPTKKLTQTPTPTGKLTPTPTPKATSTPTPPPGCYDNCSSDQECLNQNSWWRCQVPSGEDKAVCVNPSCPDQANCSCPTITPTPTNTPTSTPGPSETPAPTATPTPQPGCYDNCSSDQECLANNSSWRCLVVSGQNGTVCAHKDCPNNSNCLCQPSSNPPGSSPTPTFNLPPAGFSLPTWGAVVAGLSILGLALALAL